MEKKKHHIILVHGACHGAWCWYKIATRLRYAGHRVTVPDLAGSGIDARRHVSTYDEYVKPLMDIMTSLAPEEKVILVGHSLGGLDIAAATDRFPEKVAVGVFVTALRPDCTHSPSYVLDQQFKQYVINEWKDCQISFDGSSEGKYPTSILFGPQFLASKLYQLSPPEDVTLATTLVRPASTFQELQIATPFSKDRYGSVASIFIVCCKDLMIEEVFQHWMIQNHPVEEVIEIEGADHMPMMSTPDQLCQLILRIANNVM